MDFNKPFKYDAASGRWHLELQKAPKLFSAQSGVKFTIDSGTPTGNTGEFYKADEDNGLSNSTLEVRYFDNLSGWTSVVQFDLPTLINKLIEIMPSDKVKMETFCLAHKDRNEIGEI